MRRTAILFGVAAAGVAAAAIPAQGATAARAKTPVKKITISDDFFAPTKVTVAHGTKINWVWNANNVNTHDVELKSGPKGVRHFHSGAAASQFTYSQVLSKPGTYSLICTLHTGMHLTIVVKK